MGDRLTLIKVPHKPNGFGWMEYGEKTPAEAIAAYRSHADRLREIVQAIDDTRDEDFHIRLIKGAWVQKLVRIIQEGKP